ncbi:MAG TPA: hypothetical protein VHE35_37535 [Kofleriaceae bacterium]|nr:hypothetical protein [Kofleriaceae bacterium]
MLSALVFAYAIESIVEAPDPPVADSPSSTAAGPSSRETAGRDRDSSDLEAEADDDLEADDGPDAGSEAEDPGAPALGAAMVAAAIAGVLLWRRRRGRRCAACSATMALARRPHDAYLSAGQQTEERIGVRTYAVLVCPSCDRTNVAWRARWPRGWRDCRVCGFRTLPAATRQAFWTSEREYVGEARATCAHCGHEEIDLQRFRWVPYSPAEVRMLEAAADMLGTMAGALIELELGGHAHDAGVDSSPSHASHHHH